MCTSCPLRYMKTFYEFQKCTPAISIFQQTKTVATRNFLRTADSKHIKQGLPCLQKPIKRYQYPQEPPVLPSLLLVVTVAQYPHRTTAKWCNFNSLQL